MKKHNIFKVVLVTMLLFLLLTWILPAAYYSGQYVEQGRVQMGLFDLFSYPLTALSYFGYITLFIIFVGGFYGILYKIPAYRTFLDKIVKLFNGKEKFALSLIIVIFAVLTSICGVQYGLALFIPFVVSIILMMGYDKIVAALIVVGSITVGLIGSTYSATNLNILTQTLSLNTNYQIGVRFVILVVGIALVIFNVLMYIKKMKNVNVIEKKTVKKVSEKIEDVAVKEENDSSSKKSNSSSTKTTAKKTGRPSKKTSSKSSKSSKNANKAALKDDDIIVVKDIFSDDSCLIPSSVDVKHTVWPFVVSFALMFVLFVLAFISWGDNGFGVTLFDDVTKNVLEFELFGFPIFGKILGTVNSFGNWTVSELFLPLAFVVMLLMFIYKIKFSDVIDGFINGAKKALGPAVISIMVYSILVLVTYHPFQLVIYKAILGLSKGFNIVTTIVVMILSGLFNSDIVYSFQSVLPYYVSVVTNVENYKVTAIIAQSIYGLTMMIAPTSLVLMGTLSFLGVSYKEWLKSIWKLLLELFIILLIIFIILALM